VRPKWLESELRHSIIAFGGGALLAAVALVLVPEGVKHLSAAETLIAFAAGGGAFLLADRAIQQRGGSAAQLMAMLMDFLPEALALGALLATQDATGLLLALLIALQNLPESFNAYRELRVIGDISPARLLLAFAALVPLGPLMAWIGFVFVSDVPVALGYVMVFAAGAILYLTFQDIAPQAKLRHHWAPSLGAVAGFMIGLFGYVVLR
jgi:zinc transporter, ZIP family